MTHMLGGGGRTPPQKKCCRFVLAALPPKQTDNTRISAGRSLASTRGKQEATRSTASRCGISVGNDKPLRERGAGGSQV